MRTFNSNLKVLFYYIISSFFIELYSGILAKQGVNNHWLYYFHSIIEYFFFAIIYFKLINAKIGNYIQVILLAFFIAVVALELTKVIKMPMLNSFSRIVESFALVILSLVSLFTMLQSLKEKRITNSYQFWLNSAVLFYFGGSFFLFLFTGTLLIENSDLLFALYSIHSINNILFNVLLAITFTRKSYAG